MTATKSSLGLLTLLSMRGVGKLTAPKLANAFNSLDEIANASDAEMEPIVPANVRRTLRDREAWAAAHEAAHGVVAKAEQHGARIFGLFDPEFPSLLRTIPDAPPVLYVRGKLPESNRNVACVGTRQPSYFGSEVTRRMVRMLVEKGFGIVSGLAIGIDTESHRQALDFGGYTVAVLANGLDSIYPRENAELAERILENNGALVSEQPIGTKAFAQNLVQRDRLQCGMSLATFVFQTDVVGGTMHTVKFTLTQGRLLFAPVPPPNLADEEKSRGIRAIVEKEGSILAELLDATGDYRKLLLNEFADRPPAIGVRGVTDYPQLVELLERSAEYAKGDNFRSGSDVTEYFST